MKKKVLMLCLLVIAAVMFAFSSKVTLNAASGSSSSSTTTSHSWTDSIYSSSHIMTAATCTEEAEYYKYCTVHRKYADDDVGERTAKRSSTYHYPKPGTKLDHEYTAYGTSSSEHWKKCVNCGLEESGTRRAHNFNQGYEKISDKNASEHYRYCVCGQKHKEAHDYTDGYEAIPVGDSYDKKNHNLKCKCGYNKKEAHAPFDYIANDNDSKNHTVKCNQCNANWDEEHHNVAVNKEAATGIKHLKTEISDVQAYHYIWCDKCKKWDKNEIHNWHGSEGEDHWCECDQTPQYPRHHFPEMGNELWDVNLGERCAQTYCLETLQIKSFNITEGKDLADYTPKGSSAKYIKEPTINNDTYTLTLNHIPTNENGTPIMINIPIDQLAFTKYEIGTVHTHVEPAQEELEARVEMESYEMQASLDTLTNLINTAAGARESIYFGMYARGYEALKILQGSEPIWRDDMDRAVAEEYLKDWNLPGVFGFWAFADGIEPGDDVLPRPTDGVGSISSNNGRFSITYTDFTDGRYFSNSAFFNRDNMVNTGLYIHGGVAEPPEDDPITGRIMYCYRTTENELPKNGFEPMYLLGDYTIHDRDGRHTITASKTADLTKIDNTGYRLLGYTTTIGSFIPPSYSEGRVTKADTGSATIKFEDRKDWALITFWVEPVQMYYGQAWISTDKTTCQELTADNPAYSSQRQLLEAPDYFHGNTSNGNGSCYIDVKSLNKIALPGFMLQENRAVEYNTDLKTMLTTSSKFASETYTDETTTKYLGLSTPENVAQKTVTFKSSYAPTGETAGHAKDKGFFFVYTTPTVEILHVNYTGGSMLKGTGGQDLHWTTQILNGNAYLASLDTSAVGNPHVLMMNTNSAGTNVPVRVQYDHSDKDLVQVLIYEIVNGRETLRATVYSDDEYARGQKLVNVNAYLHPDNFAKYVSVTYSEVSGLVSRYLGVANDLFNTNKNWKVVFKYEPVQRLYVKYYDTKGNQIAVKSGDGYVREFMYKIPATGSVSHPIVDIPSNAGTYKAIAKSESDTNYITAYTSSLPRTSAGQAITATKTQGSDGKYKDKYAVIFYSNQKMLQIDYAYFTPANPYTPHPFDPSITQCESKLIDLPDVGVTISVPVIPGYTVKYYKLDPATIPEGDLTNRITQTFGKPERPLNGETTISVPSTGTDQHIVIYYEAEVVQTPHNLVVRYVDENGNELKLPDTISIPIGGAVDVNVPVIEDYAPIKYTINSGDELTDGLYEIKISDNGEDQVVTIIYTRAKKLIVEYRDNASEANIPGKETPEVFYVPSTGTLDVSTVIPGYKVVGYDLDKNYRDKNYTNTPINNPHAKTKLPDGSTVIPVTSTVRDQYLIIYYEKSNTAITLIVEYIDENGNPVAVTYTTTIEPGGSSPIPVPVVPGYTPDHFNKDGDPTNRTDWEYIVEYDPDTNEIHIKVIYKKNEDPVDPTPIIITPEDNVEVVNLYANNFVKDSRANEEYDVETAVPTSEDLYLKGEIYEYKAVADVRNTSITKNINVTLKVTYYTDVVSKTTATASFSYPNIALSYPYYYIGPDGIKVYDLRDLLLKNDAVKYSLNGEYQDGAVGINLKPLYPNENTPYLDYNVPRADVLNERLSVRSTAGYTISGWNGNSCTITINDPIYVDLSASGSGNKLKQYIEDNYAGMEQSKSILEQCSYIKVPTLSINWNTQAGDKHTMEILTGAEYRVSEHKDGLKEGEYYIPYTAARAPLYKFKGDANNADGKAYDTGLFVKEEAQNNTYSSSVEGNYRLVETLTGGNAERPEDVSNSKTPAGSIDSAAKFGVVPVIINNIRVLSPIVNASGTLTLDNDHKNSVQSVAVPSGVTALVLDKEFSIEIPRTTNYGSAKGYGNRNYNAKGLVTGSEETKNSTYMTNKNNAANTPMNRTAILTETERNAIGPSFAEYVIVKFPYDVYLMNTAMAYQTTDGAKVAYTFVNSSNEICALPAGYTQVASNGTPLLLKANEWYNLYEYIAPANCTSIKLRIPVWVEDGKSYTGVNGIQVLIAAENCSRAQLRIALQNPTAVNQSATNNVSGYPTVLGKTINTYISGRIYGLQVRDSDDPGYMSKIKTPLNVQNLPLAQRGQVTGYNMGLKLGYRFYFDFKTKGKSSAAVNIKPTIYYVSTDGRTVTKDISLFYRTSNGTYKKLFTDDLNVNMSFATTHPLVNNAGYTAETVSARQINTTRNFTTATNIGKIIGGLTLKRDIQKLPYNNIEEETTLMGFANSADLLRSAAFSDSISDVDPNRTNDVKNASGHWYGEYYLPASTVILMGNKTAQEAMTAVNARTDVRQGYLVVTFDTITTGLTDTGTGYLSYAAPTSNTQWVKENAHQSITLPSGATATIPTTGQAMAIYGGGTSGFLRANNDAETEGTH